MSNYEPGWASWLFITRPINHTILGADGRFKPWGETREAYTKPERSAIVRQGNDHPRALTNDETTLVNRNRRIARGDLDAMETWYSAQCRAPGAKRRGRAG